MNAAVADPLMVLVLERLDQMSQQMSFIVERQRKQAELIEDFTPIVKDMMKTASGKLDDLEKRGVLAFGQQLLSVGERIATSYSADDVKQLGDSIVSILDTVRAMTQPEVLAAASEAAQVLQHADETEPLGLVGMVRATRNDDVQRGMAVMMEVLRKVGQGVTAANQRQAQGKKAKLEKLLGPKKRALGVERPKALPARTQVTLTRPEAMPAPLACAVPAKAQPAAAVIDGVAFTADGAMVDPSKWTKELGATIAAAQGVAMTEPHWALIEFARRDFEQTKAAPNIRRITQGTSLTTKDVYALFPKAPARTVSKIAGLPKPAGCL